MIAKFTSFFRRSQGGIIVIAAVLLPVFLGFVGLAVDVGLWYQNKRHYQLIADSLAMGGIMALKNGSNISSYVLHDAKLNGFEATNERTITINTPPTSGAYVGNAKAVEVIITAPSNRFFTAYFLPNAFSINARAVALMSGSVGGGGANTGAGTIYGTSCLSVLDSSTNGALAISGTSQANFEQCGTYINSSSNNAVTLTGSSSLTTNALTIVGNYKTSGTSKINTLSPIITGAPPVPDPYAGTLPNPSFSGCNFTNFQPDGTLTISPGVYCNGITLDGIDNVTMSPGLYIIDRGSIKVGNSGKLQGTGVTIFFTSSTGSNYANIELSGAGIIDISASTSGTYANVVAFSPSQATGVTHKIQNGTALKLSGLAYFPTANMEYSGGVSTNGCVRLVAKTISLSNSAVLTGSCAGGGSGGALSLKLVE